MKKEIKKILEKGISAMICKKISDKIFIYGGSNFPDKFPPEGVRKEYDDIYIFDENLNMLNKLKGKIKPCDGIVIDDENILWYILDNMLYKIEIKDNQIIENEYFKLPETFTSGFGAKFGDKLVFGQKNVYEFDIKEKTLKNLPCFPAEKRNQSVYKKYRDKIIVLGGASNICHLDAYEFDYTKKSWNRLNDIPCSLTGASSCEYDENSLLILGGFNKEVFDDAVSKLSDPEYKRKYFSFNREHFNWNRKIYRYNLLNDTFSVLGEDMDFARCGAGLVKFDDKYILINGELKPGLRSSDAITFKL